MEGKEFFDMLSDLQQDQGVLDDYEDIEQNIDEYFYPQIMRVIKNGNIDDFLDIEFGNPSMIDFSYRNNIYFITAAKYGQLDMLKRLLKYKNVDPSARDNKAFILAAANGHLNVVKFLAKDPRVNITDQNFIALLASSENGHTDVTEYLLNLYSNADIPVEDVAGALMEEDIFRILKFYDITQIPRESFYFFDVRDIDDRMLDILLLRYPGQYQRELLFELLGISGAEYETDPEESIRGSVYKKLPKRIGGIVGEYLGDDYIDEKNNII